MADGEHLHYHLALHKPEQFSHKRYAMMINLLWQKAMRDQASRNTVEPIYSNGWAAYITKQFKTGNADVLDELNYNVY